MQEVFPEIKHLNDVWNNMDFSKNINKAEVPEGNYDVEIEKVFPSKTRNEKACLKWKFRITDGKFVGYVLWRTTVLVSEENLKWLKTDLSVCNVELRKMEDLPEKCSELKGIKLKISLKNTNGYTNVFINKNIKTAEKEFENQELS